VAGLADCEWREPQERSAEANSSLQKIPRSNFMKQTVTSGNGQGKRNHLLTLWPRRVKRFAPTDVGGYLAANVSSR
jgi:hypothetical protein